MVAMALPLPNPGPLDSGSGDQRDLVRQFQHVLGPPVMIPAPAAPLNVTDTRALAVLPCCSPLHPCAHRPGANAHNPLTGDAAAPHPKPGLQTA